MDKIAVEYLSADEIHPAEYNPRTITDGEIEKLKKGLGEFGIVDPLIINDDGTLVSGHQRFRAAQELGWVEFPVIRVSLDKQREKALNLALNKISGDWDMGKLSTILRGFDDGAFDIELTGFDLFEASELAGFEDITPEEIIGGERSGFSTGGLLDPKGGPDEKVTAGGPIIKIKGYTIPMTEDEQDGLAGAAELYLTERGSLYGFIAHILEG